jgi:AcrR family transcriptional regulator
LDSVREGEKVSRRERTARAVAAPLQSPPGGMRRTEILDTAANLFGSSGFRTSLQEIAEACGILPGSLYHHFESKEAIVIELVKRYQAELDGIARHAVDDLKAGGTRPLFERIVALAEAITACAIRHRAALLQTFYDPPASAGDELVSLAKLTPTAIDNAMREIFRAGRASGYIRRQVDLTRLAEQICQSMLHSGVGVFHRSPGGHQVPAVKCRMLLEGVAVRTPENAELDRSDAFAAAEGVIASWGDGDEGDDRAGLLRAAARAEFGRRGYEATTIRDIASAAGMSTGMVYRLVGSKDELLTSIMGSYIAHVTASWDAILASDSSATEKLDALLWVDINLLDRFSDEFKIQLAWLRQSPPTTSDLGQFTRRLPLIKSLLAEGERAGEFRNVGGSANVRAHCLLELTWVSENIVREAGPRAALTLARDTLLRGAAERS